MSSKPLLLKQEELKTNCKLVVWTLWFFIAKKDKWWALLEKL